MCGDCLFVDTPTDYWLQKDQEQEEKKRRRDATGLKGDIAEAAPEVEATQQPTPFVKDNRHHARPYLAKLRVLRTHEPSHGAPQPKAQILAAWDFWTHPVFLISFDCQVCESEGG